MRFQPRRAPGASTWCTTEAMPVTNAFGNTVDSGAFADTFERALAAADVEGFAAQRRGERGAGLLARPRLRVPHQGDRRLAGRGMSTSASRRTAPCSLITGTQTIGQGHETTFPQILADRLGLPNERIRLVQGDTDLIPLGGGHGSSLATFIGGTAIWRASDEIIAKGTRIAADALEAAEADIRFEDGGFVVSGTDRSVAARSPRSRAAGDAARHLSRLDPRVDDVPQRSPCRRGGDRPRHRGGGARALHGGRRLRRAGRSDGRRGPGARRDRPRGRPGAARTRGLRPRVRSAVAGSFMDYAMPRAADLPSFDLGFNRTRCTTNPLGVKGCGEAGAVAAFPAIPTPSSMRGALRCRRFRRPRHPVAEFEKQSALDPSRWTGRVPSSRSNRALCPCHCDPDLRMKGSSVPMVLRRTYRKFGPRGPRTFAAGGRSMWQPICRTSTASWPNDQRVSSR